MTNIFDYELPEPDSELFKTLLKERNVEINGIVHKLKSGDTLFIAANTKHTLLKTKKIVVWLSVYIQ